MVARIRNCQVSVMTPLPPKQGLKHPKSLSMSRTSSIVMTPLPPKQGLKRL